MKYMGSKARIAKHILPIILKDRKPNQWYIEPFVGGGNMIDKVDGLRAGYDIDKDVINALNYIRLNSNDIPEIITSEDYYRLKKQDSSGLRSWVSFALSFGGKKWGGYRRDTAGDGSLENSITQTARAKKSAIRQSKLLPSILINCGYDEIPVDDLGKNCVIYCDPPYQNTTKYKGVSGFDHDAFWDWCREQAESGHKVFISEYQAPDDFICIWQKEISSSLTQNTGAKKGIEKLFVHQSQYDNKEIL